SSYRTRRVLPSFPTRRSSDLNPLGKVYPAKDLEYLLDLSEKYGFYIMNDEIWSDIVYSDAEFTSICSLGKERNKRTLSVFGFSKIGRASYRKRVQRKIHR